MRVLVTAILLLLWAINIQAQNKQVDSINALISKSTSDTQRINLKVAKLRVLAHINLDSAIAFGNNLIKEAQKINYKKGEANARIRVAGDYCFTGNYAMAKENLDAAKKLLSQITDSTTLASMYGNYGMMYSMQNKFDTSHAFYQKSIDISRLLNDQDALSTSLQNNAIAYQQQSNYPQALINYQSALNASEQINDEIGEAYIYLNIAITYNSLDESVRAEQSYLKAVEFAKKFSLKDVLTYSYANLASVYADQKNFNKQYNAAITAATLGNEIGDHGIEASSLSRASDALANLNRLTEAEALGRKAINVADSSQQPYNIYQAYKNMGYISMQQKKYSAAIPYYKKAFSSLSGSDIYDKEVGQSYKDLSDCYKQTGDFENALLSFKMAASISDSISAKENIKKATELTLNYEFAKKQQAIKDEQQKQNDLAKARQTALITGLILTLLLAIVAFYALTNKRRANALLQQQKDKIESTLSELKSTQTQLIQSEKMASLGELTAGIAHEIQNPLNFVNNFSEVNRELIEELKMKNEKLKIEDDEVNDLLNDLADNEEKINHHGKRADAIVKGMLQHSRQTSGTKEPTDINALCDEYLRLSYHGLRAKDETFNADLKTDYDESIGKINIVPQDIGRVLLNLFNNAFYTTSEKLKAKSLTKNADYKPTVSIQTKKINDKIEIKVEDNGNGVPQFIIDKIFQPFFTTKPTGQGTGLGLSLAYDIITKQHNGTIKVQSKEGKGSMFIIEIPKTK